MSELKEDLLDVVGIFLKILGLAAYLGFGVRVFRFFAGI